MPRGVLGKLGNAVNKAVQSVSRAATAIVGSPGMTKKEEPEEIKKTNQLIADLSTCVANCTTEIPGGRNEEVWKETLNKAIGGNDLCAKAIVETIKSAQQESVRGALSVMQQAHKSIDTYEKNPTTTNLDNVTTTTTKAIADNKAKLVKEPSFLSKCFAYVSNIMSGKAEKAVEELRQKTNEKNDFLKAIEKAESTTPKL